MYINLDNAQANGLDISIEDDTDGNPHLAIRPIDGVELRSLNDVRNELVEQFGIPQYQAEGMVDEAAGSIHQGVIWHTLRKLDESKP